MEKLNDKKTYLVTGCAGFIGFHVCRMLLDGGCRVVGIDNINDYYSVILKNKRLEIISNYKNFSFYKVDIANKTLIFEIFKEHLPNIVVNLAAQAGVRYSIENPDVYISSNVSGFFNILEACRYYPVEHLIYASSSSVYGNNRKMPFSETDNVDNPVSLYAATKKSNELMAYTYSHLYNIPATGLRFFTVYGPWGRPDMAYFSFAKNIVAGKPIKVFNDGDLYRDFTYIDDVVSAIKKIIVKTVNIDEMTSYCKIYNVGNNKPEKLITFIETLERIIGKKAIKEYLPMQDGDVYATYADVSNLEKDYGFKPKVEIDAGLQAFAEWFMKEGGGGEWYRV